MLGAMSVLLVCTCGAGAETFLTEDFETLDPNDPNPDITRAYGWRKSISFLDDIANFADFVLLAKTTAPT